MATLRLEPGAAESVRTWCRVLPIDPERPDLEGWVTLRVQFDAEADACFLALGLGPRVDVVEPATLRARVAKEAAATFARQHRRPGGTRSGSKSRRGLHLTIK